MLPAARWEVELDEKDVEVEVEVEESGVLVDGEKGPEAGESLDGETWQ